MAFSDNKHQLHNWGWKYDIFLSGNETEPELAIKQLDFCIAATRDVIAKSQNYPDRFLLIRHHELCNRPKIIIDQILEFVGLEINDAQKQILYSIPKNTDSTNRYKIKDISIFDSQKLSLIEQLGFQI